MKLLGNRTKFIKNQSIDSYKEFSFWGIIWCFSRIISLQHNVIPIWYDFLKDVICPRTLIRSFSNVEHLLGHRKIRVPYCDRSVRPVRKKWFSPFYSTWVWYIHQTCTNCSSWHDLLMPYGGLCPLWHGISVKITDFSDRWIRFLDSHG